METVDESNIPTDHDLRNFSVTKWVRAFYIAEKTERHNPNWQEMRYRIKITILSFHLKYLQQK